MGLQNHRDQSSLPLLKRVQAGIKRVRASRGRYNQRIRLPITLAMLGSIHTALNLSTDHDRELTWAVASAAFFGFFRLRELLLDYASAYAQATHLSWGDVLADNCENPTMLQIHLKQSKCDQLAEERTLSSAAQGTSCARWPYYSPI